MTRVEEVSTFKAFFESLPHKGYMQYLLTGVPEYCEKQLDVNPWRKIMEYHDLYLQAQADEATVLRRLSQYQAALKAVESERDKYRDDCYKLSCEIERQQVQIDDLQDAAESMEYEIIRLKAKLYDAMYGVAV